VSKDDGVEDCNTQAPPQNPFYKAFSGRKRRPFINDIRNEEYRAKKRALYAEQVAKPVKQRIGGLKTRADFTAKEWAEFERLYGRH
jgi:hypothetical protein